MRRPALGVAALLAAALSVGVASPATADPPVWSVDNGTQSNAYQRDRPQHSFAGLVREVAGHDPAVRNRAKATSHCDGCRAIAVSVEVVLVSHVEGTVHATNLARSITDCSRCSSTALAYQFVIVDPGRITLRPRARTRIAKLVRQMRRVALDGGPDAIVRGREDRLAAQLQEALRTGVVTVREPRSRPARS